MKPILVARVARTEEGVLTCSGDQQALVEFLRQSGYQVTAAAAESHAAEPIPAPEGEATTAVRNRVRPLLGERLMAALNVPAPRIPGAREKVMVGSVVQWLRDWAAEAEAGGDMTMKHLCRGMAVLLEKGHA